MVSTDAMRRAERPPKKSPTPKDAAESAASSTAMASGSLAQRGGVAVHDPGRRGKFDR